MGKLCKRGVENQWKYDLVWHMHAKKRNRIISWEWVSIPAAVSRTDKTWTFTWLLVFIRFGFCGLNLSLQCTYFCCLHMESGLWMFPSQRGIISKFLKCENDHIFKFRLVLFTGLYLDAICSCLGSTDAKRCHMQWGKGSICHHAFETSCLQVYWLVRSIDSLSDISESN